MKRFMKGLLAIVVALTMISCATLGSKTTTITPPIVMEEAELTPGWNYEFYENNHSYRLIFYTSELFPIAIVAPISYYGEPKPEFINKWLWIVQYTTDLNDGFEMAIVDTAEEALAAANDFMKRFLTL